MANMLWRLEGPILVCVNAAENPTDAEWTRYLDAGRAALPKCKGILVVTDGGGPNAMQRKQIDEMPEARDLPVAVVTASLAARGIVTAISWFGKAIKAFAPHQVPEALGYLGLAPSEAAAACATVALLKLELIGESIESVKRAGLVPNGTSISNFVLGERGPVLKSKLAQARRVS